MEDKKLIATITGAIAAYIQMEQQPHPVTPESSPQAKLTGQKVPKRQRSIKGRKA